MVYLSLILYIKIIPMAAGVPEKSIFRTDQSQGTRIENVTLGFAKRMYRD